MTDLLAAETGSLMLEVEEEEGCKNVPVQLQQLCRMCAKPCSVAKSTSCRLLSPSPAVLYQLLHYFGINVKKGDRLPTGICNNCNQELDHMEQLKLDVFRAQLFLQQQLELYNSQTGNNENSSDQESFSVLEPKAEPCDNQDGHKNEDVELQSASMQESLSIPETTGMSSEEIDHILLTQCTLLPNIEEIISLESDTIVIVDKNNTDSGYQLLNPNFELQNINVKIRNEKSESLIRPLKINSIEMSKTVAPLPVSTISTKPKSNNKKYICRICAATYSTLQTWEEHFKSSHTDFNITKNIINKKVNSSVRVNKRSLKSSSDTCTVDFNTLSDVATNELIKVAKIGEKRRPEQTKKRKQYLLDGEEHYSCDICNCKFFNHTQLYDHIIDKHVKENSLNCEFCFTNFDNKIELLVHLKSHSKKIKYFCPICDRLFYGKCALEYHKDVHSNERNHQCSYCGKSYRTHSTLYCHIKQVHENVGRFMCEVCSKMFHTKTLLKRHILINHSHIKPHVCKVCGKGFIIQSLLRNHAYIHTTERPHHCIKCNSGFVTKSMLKRHMRRVCKIPEKDIILNF